MRRAAIVLALTLAAACASETGTTLPHIELTAALEEARSRPTGEPVPVTGSEDLGIWLGCEGEACRESALALLAQDLQRGDLEVLGEAGSLETVKLAVPGRFWTMTFGADGNLTAVHAGMMP